jgi:ribosomal protein L12E/L44/L45/RPP1/RPP2
MTYDEEKATLTVVGEVDVVKVVAKLRKAKHPATVVTVSDEKKEAEEKKKKDEEEKKKKEKEAEEKKKKEFAAMMQYCPKAYPQLGPCPQPAYCYTVDDHPGSCTIV